MTLTGAGHLRRLLVATALLAAGAAAPAGIANAQPASFNVDGYTACTEAPVPGDNPNGEPDLDSIVISCCVQNAGVPADTSYGMGCVAPAGSQSGDNPPTIVLPSRPLPDTIDDLDVIP